MAEFARNIWAPWRMQYIDSIPAADASQECFLCSYREHPEDDARNHVIWRSAAWMILLNRFPYTSGHLLIAPTRHGGRLEDLPDGEWSELCLRLRDARRVLQAALEPQGFNIGMNLGRCAGAGLPDHLHWHIIPRWGGDTNFLPVLSDIRVIPQTLEKVYELCLAARQKLGL